LKNMSSKFDGELPPGLREAIEAYYTPAELLFLLEDVETREVVDAFYEEIVENLSLILEDMGLEEDTDIDEDYED
jgi:hypothetical protein